MSVAGPLLAACIASTAAAYDLPVPIFHALLEVEGGRVGQCSRNTDGTFDCRPFQINDVWYRTIREKTGLDNATIRRRLTDDACFNAGVAGWILKKNIIDAGGDFWKGVGYYHSRTPGKTRSYMQKVINAAARQYGTGVFERKR